MELNHLKYFYFVAKEGGYTNAAKAMRIAQSAVSKMVKNLEEELHVELFEIVGRRAQLTSAGTDLYRKCEIIFEQVSSIEANTKPKSHVLNGPLNFGAAEAIASCLAPRTISKLMEKHPQVQPFMVATTASELCRLLLLRRIEFALAFHLPELPSELEIRHLYPTPFKLVVAADKFKSKEICSSFIGSREVDDTSTKTYPTLKRLQEAYPKASIKFSTNSLSAHKELVVAGLGVSILPNFMVENEIADGKLKCLFADEKFVFNMKLVCRKFETLTPAANTYLQYFLER